MGVYADYFLNGPTLDTATIVFTNADLTTLAPDGFYSDGTIVREQSGGILLNATSCPACAIDCSSTKYNNTLAGIYPLNINLGTAVGAVKLSITGHAANPIGMLVKHVADYYNYFSALGVVSNPYQGAATPISQPTFHISPGSDCSPTIAANSYVLNDYSWDELSNDWIATGITSNLSILTSQVVTSTNAYTVGVLYIPKPSAAESTLETTLYRPCSNGVVNNIEIECPAPLTAITGCSIKFAAVNDPCGEALGETYYHGPVDGSAGIVTINDWMFEDVNAVTMLANGFYGYDTNNQFEIENGIVIDILGCP